MQKSILVVDDDKINLKITQMNLSQYGYKVYTVATGMEALNFLKVQTVDYVVKPFVPRELYIRVEKVLGEGQR